MIDRIGSSSSSNAFMDALNAFQKSQKSFTSLEETIENRAPSIVPSFSETLNSSLAEVNSLQANKSAAVTSFAAGETQNVHELMVTMQKASVAINLTAAVRNKALEAYRELSRIQF